MLAERLPGLLPDLDVEESLEVSAVHSIAGTLPSDGPLLSRPPFLDPHHTATLVSIVGGGSRVLRPGAMSLAHRGVLFMDEAPEFDSRVLEGMRQPLESGQISIGRSERTATFPSQFQLVLAANPCPCGFDWGRGAHCECSPAGKRRYRSKISGPVRDRIDIYRRVHPVQRHELHRDLSFVETTATVAARVHAARDRQAHRFARTPWRRNAEVPGTMLRSHWPVRAAKVHKLEAELAGGRISARGLDRILRLSWTLADLADRAEPDDEDVETAMLLRTSGPLPIARTRVGEGAA
jgi:magnesium chelatase family protein